MPRLLVFAIALAAAGSARADVPSLGVAVDAGVPDGAGAALVWRPAGPLRLAAGLGYNGVTRGYRAGATLVPFARWFSPSLSVDVGAYREGDANPLARMITGDQTIAEPALDRVGYRYATASVGLEFGRKWATFYLHVGASRVTGRVHDLLTASTMMTDSATTVSLADPGVTIDMVSARVGLVIYFH